MSDEQGTEINFSELVGNLLAESEDHIQSLEETQKSNVDEAHPEPTADVADDDVLPDLIPASQLPDDEAVAEHDLASMVSAAIHNMDDESEGNRHNQETNVDINSKEQEWAKILRQGILQAENDMNDQNTRTHFQSSNSQTDDQVLDQDDENLRLAILNSLEHLSEEKKTKKHSKKEKKSKEKKKSSKKTDKDKSKKKEKKSKDKKSNTNNDVLNFEDVIQGFMEQTEASQSAAINQSDGSVPIGDAETEALVEATLKAFENQLIGEPASSKTKPPAKKTTKTSGHKFTKSLPPPLPMPFFPITQKRKIKSKTAEQRVKDKAEKAAISKADSPKKKKKSSKRKEKVQDTYNEDEFSKALAEMVSQVVNTSLLDQAQTSIPEQENVGKSTKKKSKQKSKTKSSEANDNGKIKGSKQSKKKLTPIAKDSDEVGTIPLDPELIKVSSSQNNIDHSIRQGTTDVSTSNADDGFDLHQIMQNAMTMAFQDQVQNQLHPSVLERFDKELSENQLPTSISDKLLPSRPAIRSQFVPPQKKKKEKKKGELKFNNIHGELPKSKFIRSDKQAIGSKIVVFKPQKIKSATLSGKSSSEESRLRIKYINIAKECARKAKKLNAARRKKLKDEQKMEKDRLKSQRKLLREERKLNRENEARMLEKIVAKGPPYPADLCLNSSGRPRRPYRRYTQDELKQRSSMSAEQLTYYDLEREQNHKDKKDKSMGIPVYKLKQLTLFNPKSSDSNSKLNDIKGSLEKVISNNRAKVASHRPSKDKNEKRPFDPTVKTVVHREKIAFHPPWQLPSNPPLALPVAKRPKHHNVQKMSKRKRAQYQRTLLSSTLLPILHTLRAAAKATASAGVDPERSREHLRSMLHQARLSISETLHRTRSASTDTFSPVSVIRTSNKENNKRDIPIPIMRPIPKIKPEDSPSPSSDQSLGCPKQSQPAPLLVSPIESKQDASDEKSSNKSLKRSSDDSAGDADIRQNVSEVINKLSTLIPSLARSNALPILPPKKKQKLLINLDEVKIPVASAKQPRGLSVTSNIKESRGLSPSFIKMEEDDRRPSTVPEKANAGEDVVVVQDTDFTKIGDNKNVTLNVPFIQTSKTSFGTFQRHKFSLPTTDSSGKVIKYTPVMKRLKHYLSPADMTRLKKVKETYRKRKWRSANAEKNKDLELRTRIKMAARKEFGESDSEAKQKWITEEYEIRKIKLELDPIVKSGGSVVVTDEELLNMVAISLENLEVARSVEKDIQEEVSKKTTERSKREQSPEVAAAASNLQVFIGGEVSKTGDSSAPSSEVASSDTTMRKSANQSDKIQPLAIAEQSIDPVLAPQKRERDEPSSTQDVTNLVEPALKKKTIRDDH